MKECDQEVFTPQCSHPMPGDVDSSGTVVYAERMVSSLLGSSTSLQSSGFFEDK